MDRRSVGSARERWQPIVRGVFMGVRIGDAIGMPWEIVRRRKIMRLTNGRGLTGFLDRDDRFFKSVRHLVLGDATDDYQLTAAVARSFIHSRGFNLDDIAAEHVRERMRTTAGWGGSTEQSVRASARWFATSGARGRGPGVQIAKKKGATGTGNGVVMKVAPIPLWDTIRAIELNEPKAFPHQVLRFGRLTHADPRASIAALAVASLMEVSIRSPVVGVGSANELRAAVDRLGQIIQFMRSIEQIPENQCKGEPVSTRLERLLTDGLLFEDPVKLAKRIGTSCFALV